MANSVRELGEKKVRARKEGKWERSPKRGAVSDDVVKTARVTRLGTKLKERERVRRVRSDEGQTSCKTGRDAPTSD